ncbi:MAG: hypothetical protein ACTSPD_19500, partial [Promethearchaeota archaeon]
MVNLNWEKKRDISDKIENYMRKFRNTFEKIDVFSNNKNNLNSSTSEFKKKQWVNRLYWGDNFDVSCHLLNNFKNKIDLIYIDPPFFSGTNYHMRIKDKDQEYKIIAYYDHWKNDIDSYLQMLYERIILFRNLLSNKGLIFVHLDWHAS